MHARAAARFVGLASRFRSRVSVSVSDRTVDGKSMSATFVRAPELAEVPYPVKMEPNLVVEFYAS